MLISPELEVFNKFNSAVVVSILVRIFILAGEAVISTPPTCNLVAFNSPPEPYTTALPSDTVPATTPSSKLISEADEVTNTLFNLRPPSTPSCEAIFTIWSPFVLPMVTKPALL